MPPKSLRTRRGQLRRPGICRSHKLPPNRRIPAHYETSVFYIAPDDTRDLNLNGDLIRLNSNTWVYHRDIADQHFTATLTRDTLLYQWTIDYTLLVDPSSLYHWTYTQGYVPGTPQTVDITVWDYTDPDAIFARFAATIYFF